MVLSIPDRDNIIPLFSLNGSILQSFLSIPEERNTKSKYSSCVLLYSTKRMKVHLKEHILMCFASFQISFAEIRNTDSFTLEINKNNINCKY